MYILLIVVTILLCLLLSVVVLVQNPKGGGLDASFGGVSNNTFGAKRTTDFLEKATWGLAIALVVLSILSAVFIGSRNNKSGVAKDIYNANPTTGTTTEGGIVNDEKTVIVGEDDQTIKGNVKTGDAQPVKKDEN